MSIPLVDLKGQTGKIKTQIMEKFSDLLDSCQFVLGAEVGKFEEEFAKYIGSKFSIGLGSGTEALHLAVRAAEIGPGDEVLVPANTFIATAIGVTLAGATPVFVDVTESDFLIDFNDAEKKVTAKTKAIIPVHLYGRMVDPAKMLSFSANHKLFLIEDAAQSHGAEINGRRAGTVGKIGCFSFFPGKNLGAFGDAGGVTTEDPALHEKLMALRNYGSPKKYHHPVFGTNSRLDSIQACVLRVKLPLLDQFNSSRRNIARNYNEMLQNVGDLKLPEIPAGEAHVFHLYVVRTKHRDELMTFLNAEGVGASIHYPFPCHLQGAYKDLGYKAGSLPVTERLAKEILSLPVYPEMTPDQQQQVVAKVRKFFDEKR